MPWDSWLSKIQSRKERWRFSLDLWWWIHWSGRKAILQIWFIYSLTAGSEERLKKLVSFFGTQVSAETEQEVMKKLVSITLEWSSLFLISSFWQFFIATTTMPSMSLWINFPISVLDQQKISLLLCRRGDEDYCRWETRDYFEHGSRKYPVFLRTFLWNSVIRLLSLETILTNDKILEFINAETNEKIRSHLVMNWFYHFALIALVLPCWNCPNRSSILRLCSWSCRPS